MKQVYLAFLKALEDSGHDVTVSKIDNGTKVQIEIDGPMFKGALIRSPEFHPYTPARFLKSWSLESCTDCTQAARLNKALGPGSHAWTPAPRCPAHK